MHPQFFQPEADQLSAEADDWLSVCKDDRIIARQLFLPVTPEVIGGPDPGFQLSLE